MGGGGGAGDRQCSTHRSVKPQIAQMTATRLNFRSETTSPIRLHDAATSTHHQPSAARCTQHGIGLDVCCDTQEAHTLAGCTAARECPRVSLHLRLRPVRMAPAGHHTSRVWHCTKGTEGWAPGRHLMGCAPASPSCSALQGRHHPAGQRRRLCEQDSGFPTALPDPSLIQGRHLRQGLFPTLTASLSCSCSVAAQLILKQCM